MAKYKISSTETTENLRSGFSLISRCLSTPDLIELFVKEVTTRDDFVPSHISRLATDMFIAYDAATWVPVKRNK